MFNCGSSAAIKIQQMIIIIKWNNRKYYKWHNSGIVNSFTHNYILPGSVCLRKISTGPNSKWSANTLVHETKRESGETAAKITEKCLMYCMLCAIASRVSVPSVVLYIVFFCSKKTRQRRERGKISKWKPEGKMRHLLWFVKYVYSSNNFFCVLPLLLLLSTTGIFHSWILLSFLSFYCFCLLRIMPFECYIIFYLRSSRVSTSRGFTERFDGKPQCVSFYPFFKWLYTTSTLVWYQLLGLLLPLYSMHWRIVFFSFLLVVSALLFFFQSKDCESLHCCQQQWR